MDSAKGVLRSIVEVTHQVRNATIHYSTTRSTRQVRHQSLVRLEVEFQTLTNACRAILDALEDPSLCRRYMVDDRLVDWLSGTEPETCLDTLREMKRLIRIERGGQAFSGLVPPSSACGEDDIHAAIVLFQTHKTHFHFLLTAEVWNHANIPHGQTVPLGPDDVHTHGQINDVAMKEQRKMIVAQKLKRLLRNLDPLDCRRKHRETLTIRQSDTCGWLLSTPAYRSWKIGESSFLWLRGKAGAGKTVLIASVIDDLTDSKDDDEPLAFFYCDFRMQRSTSAVEVLRSILAQVVERLCAIIGDPIDLLDDLLEANDNLTGPFYNVEKLSRCLSKVAVLCPRKPFVVIDALDECREMESLLHGLILSSRDIRVFASSRPLQNITSILSYFSCISMDEMASDLSADILLHVTRQLDSRPRLRTFDETLKKGIQSKLCAGADGMFRWVQCQIDTLDRCTTVSDIRRVLESLPEGLEETYRRILLAVDRRDERLVRRALVWLVTALRPMRMKELLEALMIDRARRAVDSRFELIAADLLEFCRCLVIHDCETDIISLSHMSVREYLLGPELSRAELPQYHIVLEDGHERLARLCMAYIAFCLEESEDYKAGPSIPTRSTPATSRSFLKYVLTCGFNHFSYIGQGNGGLFEDMKILQQVIDRYAKAWDRMCSSVSSTGSVILWPTSQHDFVLYILVAFGSESLIQSFVDHAPVAARAETNPLVYAAHFGKTGHAKILITAGALVDLPGLAVCDMDELIEDDMQMNEASPKNVNASTAISDKGNTGDVLVFPLQVAVEHWSAAMTDLLFAEGGTVPDELFVRTLIRRPDKFPLYIIKRLLQTAAFSGWATTPWNNQSLLEAMIEREEEDPEESGAGDLAICVHRLAEVGYAQNSSGETNLHIAAKNGCTHVVRRLLLTHTTLPVDIISYALHATSPERVEIVRLLINHGADVNPLAANGDTLLHIAIKSSNESECLTITQVLLEAGINPCGFDADDRPPMHIAVMRGFVSVVQYLLSKDIPPPRRILYAATQATPKKRDEMIRLLVHKGANLDVLDDVTLHQVAISSVDELDTLEIAEIFIDAAECDIRDDVRQIHRTVISNHLLSSLPSEDIFSVLSCDGEPSRAQHLAFLRKVDKKVSVEGSKTTLQDITRRLSSEKNRSLRAAEVLVSIQRNLSSWNYSAVLGAFFANVAAQGMVSSMEYLRLQSVPLPPRILFNALSLKAQSWVDIVKMLRSLISSGANAGALEANGDTVIHAAASMIPTEDICLEAMKIFIDAGCNPSLRNCEGELPIEIAVARGFAHVVKHLLLFCFPPPPNILFSALGHPGELRMNTVGIVRNLVLGGADVRGIAPNGDSLLHIILRTYEETQCLELMEVFSEAGCNPSIPDAEGMTPIHIAILREFARGLQYLLSWGASIPQLDFPLYILLEHWGASQQDIVQVTRVLAGGGVNIHVTASNGDSLLHVVMRRYEDRGCLELTKILVKAGCKLSSLDAQGRTPFQIAFARKLALVVGYLVEVGVPLSSDDLFLVLQWQQLHDNFVDLISVVLRKGVDIHVLAPNGNTLLHAAIDGPHYEDVCFRATKLLAEAGCSVVAPGADGKTPVQLAMDRRFFSVGRYLMARGASLPPDLLLRTLASPRRTMHGLPEIIAFLIEQGADVHARTDDDDTLLHLVLGTQHPIPASETSPLLVTVRYLVMADVDPHARNALGRTPLELAAARYPEIEWYLRHGTGKVAS